MTKTRDLADLGGGFIQTGTGAVQRTVEAKLKDVVSVKDFGAVGDGVADDAAAIQAAIDYVASSDIQTIYIPSGKYKLNSGITISNGSISLVGDGYTTGPNPDSGTWFVIDSTSFTPFTVSGTASRGTEFVSIGFHQLHPSQVLGWTPTPYPPIFSIQNTLGEVIFTDVFCTLINKFVHSYNSGRLFIRNLRGQFVGQAIYIDKALDVVRIDQIHDWTYVTSNQYVLDYSQSNCDLITLGRVDTPIINNSFTFASRSLIRCITTADGYATKLLSNSLASDFTKHALWVESNEFTCQVDAINSQHEIWGGGGAGIPASSSIYVSGNNARLQVAALHCERLPGVAVNLVGTGNTLNAISALFRYINQNSTSGAVSLGSGSNAYFGTPPIIIDSNNARLTDPGSTGLAQSAVHQVNTKNDINALQAVSSTSGNGVSVRPFGSDASINLRLEAKGPNGSVKLVSNDVVALRADSVSGDSTILVRSGAGNISFVAESAASNAGITLTPKGTGRITCSSPLGARVYTVATLPSAVGEGAVIYVSNETGGAVLAFSDGTNWRRVTDRAIVA
jgi:hypothetical protein